MASFRDAREHPKELNDGIARLIDAATGLDFEREVERFFTDWMPVHDFSVAEFRRDHRPEVLYYNPSPGAPDPDIYLKGLYLLDPLYEKFAAEPRTFVFHNSSKLYSDFHGNEIYKKYLRFFASQHDLGGLFVIDDDVAISVSMFFKLDNEDDYIAAGDVLRSQEEVLDALFRLQQRFVRHPESATHLGLRRAVHKRVVGMLESFGRDILTPREKDLVDLILRGHSTKSAARVLGIAPGTAGIHRSNIYAKFDVQTQGELFWLFLSTLTEEPE